jgi:hypothetical protein
MEPMDRFETVRGATTIKTTLYRRPDEDDAAAAVRGERERVIGQHRADQLEPIRKRIMSDREPVFQPDEPF